jgi:hypothetical protein
MGHFCACCLGVQELEPDGAVESHQFSNKSLAIRCAVRTPKWLKLAAMFLEAAVLCLVVLHFLAAFRSLACFIWTLNIWDSEQCLISIVANLISAIQWKNCFPNAFKEHSSLFSNFRQWMLAIKVSWSTRTYHDWQVVHQLPRAR